jgi:3-oxoadipate enol-lactonase
MPFAEVRDTRTYYEMEGYGPRTLYISGSGGQLWSQPGTLDRLIARTTVLAYDKRGLGQTEVPDTEWTMADFADDAAALLDVVGWDACYVVGTSFGGMVAQELAIRHPERVARLVLNCTSPGGEFPSFPLHTLLDLPDEERISRRVAITDVRHDEAWQTAHPEEYAKLAEQTRARTAYADEDAERRHRKLMAARSTFDALDRLSSIHVPTLIAGGRHDGIAPVRKQELLHERIEGSRLELFEGGHGFMREDPRALETIVSFLGSLPTI